MQHDDSPDNHTRCGFITRQMATSNGITLPHLIRDSMRFESVRLATFSNWPSWATASPTLLARAGFYYTGMRDEVTCFCCGIRLKDWQPGNRPLTEHNCCCPRCQHRSRNVPLGETPVVPRREMLQVSFLICGGLSFKCLLSRIFLGKITNGQLAHTNKFVWVISMMNGSTYFSYINDFTSYMRHAS